MIWHRRQRNDRAAMTNHRTGKPMTCPRRRDRIRAAKPGG
jgi:hypothetical protein